MLVGYEHCKPEPTSNSTCSATALAILKPTIQAALLLPFLVRPARLTLHHHLAPHDLETGANPPPPPPIAQRLNHREPSATLPLIINVTRHWIIRTLIPHFNAHSLVVAEQPQGHQSFFFR